MPDFKMLYRKTPRSYYYGLEILSSVSISATAFPMAAYLGLGSGFSVILSAAFALCIFAVLAVRSSRSNANRQIRLRFAVLPLLNIAIIAVVVHVASTVL